MDGLAVITGSARGLGRALAQVMVERGWTVCGIDMDADAQRDAEAVLGSLYVPYVGDVSDEAFVQASMRDIEMRGHVDVLVNNAGQPSFKVPTEYVGADMDRCLKGLKGMMLWSVATLRATGEERLKIVNVMSTAATRGNAHESVYCAAKWGEKGYTESLKAAYKGSTVKVVGVYPGGIDTAFYRDSRDYVSSEKQRTFMDPDELATVIANAILSPANLTVSDMLIERNYQ